MRRATLFLSVFLWLFSPVFSPAEEAATDEPVVETRAAETGAITTEVIVLEDGTEEVQITMAASESAHRFADERVLAIEREAQEKILAIVEEIKLLADRSDEGELQRRIERIKLDAEIARLEMQMEDAWDAQDHDLADKLRDEIEHVENLDTPVIGVPGKQPAP